MKFEGRWRLSKDDAASPLAYPKVNEQPWVGKVEFLAALTAKETMAVQTALRGMSFCRLCNEVNGSDEFALGEWRWPEGLRHYIEAHDVRPSDEFIAFVLSTS